MDGWTGLLAAVMLAISVLIAPPAVGQEALPVVELHPGRDAPAINPNIRYTKALGDIGDVPIERIFEVPLHQLEDGSDHFGLPGERVALALSVRNAGEEAGSWILTTGRGSLTHFRLYEYAGRRAALLVDGADPAAASQNLRTYQAFSTEVVLEPGQEKTFLIDFRSDNSTYMPLRIETFGTFFQDRRGNIALVSGVTLAVTVLIFLNFVFFSITGHREFGWLAVAQTFFALNIIHTEGYLTIFLLADRPLLGVAIEDVIKCAFAAAMAQFARSFLRTPERFPRLDSILRVLIVAGLAVSGLQVGLPLYGPEVRWALHSAAWAVTAAVALLLPLLGLAALRQNGRQLWPLFVGWASLAIFIVYGAIASLGVFPWLPINWHWVGPVGLFEVMMVTLALGLNLKKIQADRQAADANYARSMAERLRISVRAARLAQEKEFALATVDSQNALLHASGHDSRQVILALNSAIDVLKRSDDAGVHGELTEMLQSSADYLSEIASTTMSGAAIVGSQSSFLALSAFKGDALVEPLLMMFKGPFAGKGLTLDAEIDRQATIVSDRPLLMRALANLLSNSHHHTRTGGAILSLRIDRGRAIIELVDTGTGMSDATARQLMDDDLPRMHAGANGSGTGSDSNRRGGSSKAWVGCLKSSPRAPREPR